MRKVITYWTFDIFHEWHKNILKSCKALWDYLIVWVTWEEYDQNRGKLNVKQSLIERIENVKKSWLADEVIIEYRNGQKVSDIKKHKIDIFWIWSDWEWKFDHLNEYCKVIYLPRTKWISSTQIRNSWNWVLNIGLIWAWRIAHRFVKESKYVSWVNILWVCSKTLENAKLFQEEHELSFWSNSIKETIQKVDALYIATPHGTHYSIAKEALLAWKHVLCEKPAVLKYEQLEELLSIANDKWLLFLEGIKTLFSPGFIRLVEIAKSWLIWNIKDIDCTFTKLMNWDTRELSPNQDWWSFNELSSYVLAGIVKLLWEPTKTSFFSYRNEENVDLYTKIICNFTNEIATWNIWLWVKKEWDMVIAWTKWYIYVPAPWWLTQEFEVRYEDRNENQKFFYEFQWDGLRYEISEFSNLINSDETESWKYTQKEMLSISKLISEFNKN